MSDTDKGSAGTWRDALPAIDPQKMLILDVLVAANDYQRADAAAQEARRLLGKWRDECNKAERAATEAAEKASEAMRVLHEAARALSKGGIA